MKTLVILLVLCVASCHAVEERRMSLLDRILGPKVLHSGSVSISRSESVGPSLSQLLSESSSGSSSSSSSGSSSGGSSKGLKKAVIVNPNETPALADTLANIATVLGKEPAAAVANDATSLDAEDGEEAEEAEAAADDVTLMGDDDCDSPLPSEAGGCKKKKKKGGSGSSGGSESGSSGSSSGSESAGTAGQIHKLEKLIQFAMKVSKSIPENVRKLEQLKAKEETAVENKARHEAVKTLEEHRRLMAEMAEHIVKLRAKLNELIAKRSQLEVSDERLRKELQQMNESGAKL